MASNTEKCQNSAAKCKAVQPSDLSLSEMSAPDKVSLETNEQTTSGIEYFESYGIHAKCSAVYPNSPKPAHYLANCPLSYAIIEVITDDLMRTFGFVDQGIHDGDVFVETGVVEGNVGPGVVHVGPLRHFSQQ